MEPRLPEGVIAPSVKSYAYALDSAVLAKTGEVHFCTKDTSGVSVPSEKTPAQEVIEQIPAYYALDDRVELNISGDERLEKLKGYARDLGARFAQSQSKEYIAVTNERERKIADLLFEKIGEIYGGFSHDTSAKGENAAETGKWNTSTVYLKDMKKDTLVCRHLAPVVSVLLHEAEVPNYLVGSSAAYLKRAII